VAGWRDRWGLLGRGVNRAEMGRSGAAPLRERERMLVTTGG